jgi:hypothetical protein
MRRSLAHVSHQLDVAPDHLPRNAPTANPSAPAREKERHHATDSHPRGPPLAMQ